MKALFLKHFVLQVTVTYIFHRESEYIHTYMLCVYVCTSRHVTYKSAYTAFNLSTSDKLQIFVLHLVTCPHFENPAEGSVCWSAPWLAAGGECSGAQKDKELLQFNNKNKETDLKVGKGPA